MTDEQIIKALECCLEDISDCESCPYEDYCSNHKNKVLQDILNLLKRQQAEIERLQEAIDYKNTEKRVLRKLLDKAEIRIEATEKECQRVIALYNEKVCLCEEQKADKERLEIELQAMRNAANSYKSKVKTLEMDNAQLHSDIINANQNFDHINRLWEAEKEKVEKAKQKVINVCKELQTAKAEIERLKGWQDLLKAEKHSLIKSEAIKEFAERLSDRICDSIERSLNNADGNNYYVTDVYETIDNLVKEMTEQKGR